MMTRASASKLKTQACSFSDPRPHSLYPFLVQRKPKGFCFCEFMDPRDADEAVYKLDKSTFAGRVLDVQMSSQSRKTPSEMKQMESKCESTLTSKPFPLYMIYCLSFYGCTDSLF
jgi:RNA recognition motif-containing protein